MPISIGVGSKGVGTGVSSQATTGVTTNAGSFFQVGFVVDTALTVTSVTDSKGNSYSLVKGPVAMAGGGGNGFVYRSTTTLGGVSHTATVLMSGAGRMTVLFAEVIGASGFDLGDGVNDAASPFASPSIATTKPRELLIGMIGGDSASNPATHAESTGMAILAAAEELNGAANWVGCFASRVVSATGSYNCSFTENGSVDTAVFINGWIEAAGGVAGTSRLFSNPGAGPFMAARFPDFKQGIAPTAVAAQIGQPWLMWATQERVDAEEDIYRQPNHQLLHRYRFNFQTVGQPQFLTRFRTSTPEVPEPYDVVTARPFLHLYRQAFQTVGQSYRLWPSGRITLEPEDQQTAKPTDLTPFRATTPVATGRQPWFIWLTPKIDWEIEVLAPKANHDLLHRYRFNFQTVGQPWMTWPGPEARLEPEDDPRRLDQYGLHRFRTGFQTVGQPWLYWIKPQARIDDEPNAPAKAADLSPFRTTAPSVQPGQPWFMFQAAEPDLTIEPDAVRTDHAAALYPFRPHDATEPVIVVVSPEPAGSVPGWVPDSEGRLHGPYKRKGQVFGETFPLSPDLGAQLPITPASVPPLLLRMSDGIDALATVESAPVISEAEIIAAFALWAMMDSDGR